MVTEKRCPKWFMAIQKGGVRVFSLMLKTGEKTRTEVTGNAVHRQGHQPDSQ